MRSRRSSEIARAALVAALAVLSLAAPAAAAEVDAKVGSLREGKLYLELGAPRRLRPGARILLRPAGAEQGTVVVVVASSSRFLVIESPGGLEPGAAVTIAFDQLALAQGAAPPGAPSGGSEGRAPTARGVEGAPAGPGGIVVGRPQPTAETWTAQPPPKRAPVPFRRVVRGGPAGGPGAPRPPGAGPGGAGAGDPDGETTDEEPEQDPANEVSGDVELGIDAAFDDATSTRRTTVFARASLEVDRVGGSDRTRLFFYGGLRQPFDGEWDLTGKHRDHAIFEVSALELVVDARPEQQVQSFTDRIELGLGRGMVEAMTEAGLVDGVRTGVRFGDFTVFGFGGFAASPDPHTTNWDSLVYGGGVRYARTFAHSGALRLSLGGAQERFRGEGERDFLEAQLDLRYDRFGARGALVVDFFDTVRDKRDIRCTTGVLRLSFQATADVRLEAGYSERAELYQAEFIRELDPFSRARLSRDARRTIDALIALRLGAKVDASLRGAYYLGGRPTAGGGIGIGKNDTFTHDRIALDVMVHHRQLGAGHSKHSTDPFVNLSYSWFGEAVTWQFSVFWRATLPDDTGDRRFGGRVSFDASLTDAFGLRAWTEVQLQDGDQGDRGEVFFLGVAGRYRF